ncbi:MAG: hypothetical protein ACOYMA_00015 [Bacteroidia bacterium]
MINVNELIANPILFEAVGEKDIDDISDQLIPILGDKVNSTANFLTHKVMATSSIDAKKSFEYKIKEFIKSSVYSYVANGKWRINVPLPSYVMKALSTYVKDTLDENNMQDKVRRRVYSCPACKYRVNTNRQFLVKDGDSVLCNFCYKELNDNPLLTNDQKILLNAFSKHSLKGVKCPGCSNFVPNSALLNGVLTCPYPGCNTLCNNSEKMQHPFCASNVLTVSMNDSVNSSIFKNKKEIGDNYCGDNLNACDSLINEQELAKKISIIKEIISLQKKTHAYVRRMPTKACMYDAFNIVLEKYPEDMVAYLTVSKQNYEISIQALIYQEFAKLMKRQLPIKMFYNGDQIHIDDPLDKSLHLFSGIREFSNFIDHNSTVKRKILYKYENGGKILDNEESFIGEIISVTSAEGKDLSSYIDIYNFTGIRFNFSEESKPGTDVIVKYYSLLPNYTLGSMIHMQRIKKKISDSANKKLGTL